MSNEFQDHQPMKEGVMEIELEPRVNTQTLVAPEVQDDTVNPGCPKGDDEGDQAFPRQTFQKAPTMASDGTGLTGEAIGSPYHEDPLLDDLRHEEEATVAARSHCSQDITGNNVHMISDESIILNAIRDELLLKLGDTTGRTGDIHTSSNGSGTVQIIFGDGIKEAVELIRRSTARIGPARMKRLIRDHWPQSLELEGVKGCIVSTRSHSTRSLVVQMGDSRYESSWRDWCEEARNRQDINIPIEHDYLSQPMRQRFTGKIVYCASNKFRKGTQYFPLPLLACALRFEEPFTIPRGNCGTLDVGYSASFLLTDFGSECNMPSNHHSQDIIHWQIRYFNPTPENTDHGTNYLTSERQTVTVQQGLEKTCLQEKRVRISFRRLKQTPEIFSIFVFTDEDTFPDTYKPDKGFDFGRLWDLHGSDPPIAHYFYEICRVFKLCMEAWGKTLDMMDGLVHIKLGDLDKVKKVEELMFDNSFKRSRDYFVALQILRIIDEWLDEAQSSIQDLSKSPMMEESGKRPMAEESGGYFKMMMRFVEDQAAPVRSRVRDKKEEINSLRDGLFNATSLRESTKAMALNQAIYVFTVVTVLFTPVSFLATFWALPFLNNPVEGTDIVPVPAAFRNSFIIMPILTYALVIGVAWFVGQRNSVDALSSRLKALAEITGKLLGLGWNLLRKKQEKDKGKTPYP
ncbi:hypothetical protein H9Q74_000246 [Fusarium xylarioides]|nr:hypothetical protein H9Q71_006475 [Fusarium xylarioides]KAG5829727.1 hypothetical protein H9Q74_000246 [Fusarium xylarioides]